MNFEEAIEIASFPDKRITAIAPLPEGVAKAIIVSLCSMVINFKQKYSKNVIWLNNDSVLLRLYYNLSLIRTYYICTT
ncbi:hypothetical protein GCM10011531_01640 [Aquaticitalea lipolytica]|uniref:Uncharacterized protein n=1 Tax=Aquaticitalea lipolytica TaxID=1247562 RepID=A0A8J2TLH3_9FLAO|nr:hypothetical protein GCM10011531_01640 [Aquaticitalea lipolytica]